MALPKPINNLRPCMECDRMVKLYDKGQLCMNGMCSFTGKVQPLHGSWYCSHFMADGVRMHPRVLFKYKKKNKRRRKKNAKVQ